MLSPGFAYTPVASVSHRKPSAGLAPAPTSCASDLTGTNIQNSCPFARGRNPNCKPPWLVRGDARGRVGQYGPLDPRKLQLWLVRSCQGVVEVEFRGSPKHLIGWAASMAVCVCGGHHERRYNRGRSASARVARDRHEEAGPVLLTDLGNTREPTVGRDPGNHDLGVRLTEDGGRAVQASLRKQVS